MEKDINKEIFELLQQDQYRELLISKNYTKPYLIDLLSITLMKIDSLSNRPNNERNAGKKPYLLRDVAFYWLHKSTLKKEPLLKATILKNHLENFRKIVFDTLMKEFQPKALPIGFQKPVGRTTVELWIKKYKGLSVNDPREIDSTYRWIDLNFGKFFN
jgi:hypothetical protein